MFSFRKEIALKRLIVLVFAIVCILASCIPAFAIPPNSALIFDLAESAVSTSGTTKTVNVIVAVAYTTQTTTPAWTMLNSTISVVVYVTEHNPTTGNVVNYNKTFRMAPLTKLEWHKAPVLGTIILRNTVPIIVAPMTSTNTVTFAFKLFVNGTWTRATGAPLTDTHGSMDPSKQTF